jgi:hypothetical protein
MTSPIRRVTVRCTACRRTFRDFYRPSINLGLGESWTDEDIEQAITVRCSHCGLLHREWHEERDTRYELDFEPAPPERPARPVPRKAAVITVDKQYRYALWRTWDPAEQVVMFIGCNPSVADAQQDDPTLRRCISFAKAWGFGGLVMANLFAWRSTDPTALHNAMHPVGANNDSWLLKLAADAALVIAAWGNYGHLNDRGTEVRGLLAPVCKLHALAITAEGEPRHPLYVKKDRVPIVLPTP